MIGGFIMTNSRKRYNVFTLLPTRKNAKFIQQIKAYYVQKVVNYGYSGFSYKVDNFFDRNSSFFCATDYQKNIQSILRCTLKKSNFSIPIEYGLRKNGQRYKIEDGSRVAELNTFAFSDFYSISLLWESLVHFVNFKGIQTLLCLVDPANQCTKKLYQDIGFSFSSKYPDLIHFKTYGKRKEKCFEPTYWKIMELKRQNMVTSFPLSQ